MDSAVLAEPIEKLSDLVVPSITIIEVFRNVLRQRGEEAALIVTAHMKQGKVIPLDSELAVAAAKYGVIHNLALADSVIFATAQKYAALLWTHDHGFKGLPGVRYIYRQNT